jgi:hypothetical protein
MDFGAGIRKLAMGALAFSSFFAGGSAASAQVVTGTLGQPSRKGTVKDVQGMLRHSRTPTTTDVYMQVMPHGVQATVNAINAELRRKTRNEAKKMGTLLPNATKLGEGVPASC